MNLSSYPHLVKEWHPTKNGDLTPDDFTHGSHSKVWWVCPKEHSFVTAVKSRTVLMSSCPYCAGKKASKNNNFLALFPEIAKEWHPTRNVLKPEEVMPGSHKQFWWLCSEGHSFKQANYCRTGKQKQGCPFCSNQKDGKDNNLKILYPEIAKEWHPTKNKDLLPEEVIAGTSKKAWWLCPKGHSYFSQIRHRKNGSGCPKCSNQSSEPEIRILSEFKWIFDEVHSRHKIKGKELDIFVPKFNIAVEYDGKYFHKNKEHSDLNKNKFLVSSNIALVRVREKPLKPLSKNDVIVNKNELIKKDLDCIFKEIYPFVDTSARKKIDEYFDKLTFVNEELYKVYRSYFPSPLPEKSLLKTHPLISSEWDFEKNHPLKPENYTYGSNQKIWWLCNKGHSFEATIKSKKFGTGCPFCSGKIASEENNLKYKFPEIAKEWHPIKNSELTPNKVTAASHKKVWWLCPENHSYEAQIFNRTGNNSGCPFCSGRKKSKL